MTRSLGRLPAKYEQAVSRADNRWEEGMPAWVS